MHKKTSLKVEQVAEEVHDDGYYQTVEGEQLLAQYRQQHREQLARRLEQDKALAQTEEGRQQVELERQQRGLTSVQRLPSCYRLGERSPPCGERWQTRAEMTIHINPSSISHDVLLVRSRLRYKATKLQLEILNLQKEIERGEVSVRKELLENAKKAALAKHVNS
jgi:hypothetical protein